MATLAFKPYTYKPTTPRFKSTITHRRPDPEQVSILNKFQNVTSSVTSLSTSRPAADKGGYRPGIRGTGTGTVLAGNDKANNDEIDDNRDLPTIEELLFTKLQAQGFTTGDRGPDKTSGVKEIAADKRSGSVDQSRLAQIDNSGRSPDDLIVLQGDSNLSASEADANDVNLRAESATAPGAGLFDSPETAVNSTTPAPPRSSDGWHDIDDFLKLAPHSRLAEQGASTPDSLLPHAPSSRLSSEPLYNSISPEGLCRARSKTTTSSSSPPPHGARSSPETQLSQESRLHTSGGVADKHELVDHDLDTLLLDEGARKQQEVEQEKDEGNTEDEYERPQQEMNAVAPLLTIESAGGISRLANRQQSLIDLDSCLEPRYDEEGSRSSGDSDDELNSTNSAEDDEKKPRPAKQKQLSSSHDGLTRKKRRRLLQESSSRQRRPLIKSHRQYLKSHSPLDQCSRVATRSSANSQLPSPAPSILQSIDTKMSLSDSNLSPSSRATPPMLTEITFRLHSTHCYSFTAIVRDDCDRRGVSFSQVARLIESIGHVGKVDDFTIKPIEQHSSFLVAGFSHHTSFQPSSGGGTVSTVEVGRIHRNTTRTRLQDRRAVDVRALVSRSESLSSDDNSRLSDSDPESSSDDDGRSSTSKHSRWDDIDEQRLLAYKKEDKSWDWIFKKFLGRTRAAIRTRWTMVQRKVR